MSPIVMYIIFVNCPASLTNSKLVSLDLPLYPTSHYVSHSPSETGKLQKTCFDTAGLRFKINDAKASLVSLDINTGLLVYQKHVLHIFGATSESNIFYRAKRQHRDLNPPPIHNLFKSKHTNE